MTFDSIDEAKEAEKKMSRVLDSVQNKIRDLGIPIRGELRSSLSVPEVWGQINFKATNDLFLVVDVDGSMELKYPNLTEIGRVNSKSFDSVDELLSFLKEYFV